MGDESVWKTMIPDVIIQRRRPSRHIVSYPTAYFVDNHWTCRKANESYVFNPYDHYQKKGTHGFCQTFCMMYLLGLLPEPTGYYKTYNKAALQFIYSVIKFLPENHPTYICHDPKSVVLGSIRTTLNRKGYSEVAECCSHTGQEPFKEYCHLHFSR